jgi:hypothetical protein
MNLADLTEQEKNVLDAARAYADALAVLRGKPPFSAWDAAKIGATRNQLLAAAMTLSGEREPGSSIPGDAPAPPDLSQLIERFITPRDGLDAI